MTESEGGCVKRTVNLFRQHRANIKNFLWTVIQSNAIDMTNESKITAAFAHLAGLQTIYKVGSDYKQITPNYYKRRKDESRVGIDKQHYFSTVAFDEMGIYMTNAYIHHMTGTLSITLVQKSGDDFIVYDFDLLALLEELKLIEHNSRFERMNQLIYAVGGYLLALIALFLIVYGGSVFAGVFLFSNEFILHEIFKAIIAITLGLAIYDLAKTILENEVLYKNVGVEREGQYQILGKFLVSIIIALSIESLMVVFKIALDDHTELGYAFFLIFGVTLMIAGLGIFYYLTRTKCEEGA